MAPNTPIDLNSLRAELKAELKVFAESSLRQELAGQLETFKANIIKELLDAQKAASPARAPIPSSVAPERTGQVVEESRSIEPQTSPVTAGEDSACSPTAPLIRAKEENGAEEEEDPSENKCSLAKFVNHPRFDHFASALVFASVISCAVQTDYMARISEPFVEDGGPPQEPPLVFRALEIAFCVIFVTEISLRIAVHKAQFFCVAWNIFDLTLVMLQVLESVMSALNETRAMPMAPFLRALRIARVVRFTRFLRLVPNLRTLIVQVFHSLFPLVWVFVLIFLVTAVFGVILTQVVTEYKVATPEDEWRLKEEKLEMFSNLEMSMLSLYQTISDGKHWGELYEPLEEINPAMAVLFVAYTFFVIFAFMNVVTSHFVETAVESAQEDATKEMLEQLEDIFKVTVENPHPHGSATKVMINKQQFHEKLEQNAMKDYLRKLYQYPADQDVDPKKAEQDKVFEILDEDSSGSIEMEELLAGCVRLTRPASALDLMTVKLLCEKQFEQCEKKFEQIISAQDGPDTRHQP